MTLEREDAASMDMPPFPGYQNIVQALSQADGDKIKQAIIEAGITTIDPAYSFAEGASAVDILMPKARRLLIYQTNPRDEESVTLFQQHHLPTFTAVSSLSESGIRAIALPYGSRPLSRMNFEEREAVQGYIGASEIFSQLGKYLAVIQQRTGKLPEAFSLGKVAFTSGYENPIRLVPPISLSAQQSIDQIAGTIQRELLDRRTSPDPQMNVQTLREGFLTR